MMLENQEISLCETLNRVLNKGVVVAGTVTISIADIDLLYLDLHCLLSSIKNITHLGSEGNESRLHYFIIYSS